ncbi:MAG TPA: ABC transporter permease [Gemmatimonadaceae bacterium]|nr:ABC transporter permease [Gemmatimonadaceae bacterium]
MARMSPWRQALVSRQRNTHARSDRRLRVSGSVVSGNFFSVLGTRPLTGRLVAPADDARGAEAVAVLSKSFCKRRFDGNPGVVGTTVRINGFPFEIVGVAPRGFVGATFDAPADMWLPLSTISIADPGLEQLKPLERRRFTWLSIIGRLAPGATLSRALPANDAAIDPSQRAEATRLSWLLVGVTTIVLLIACADAAGLLIAPAERRRRELAIRSALGASRARIVRQTLVESLPC